jgi:hypothetical protein
MDLVSCPGQKTFGQEKDALTGADSAPDCHRTRRNQTLRFALFQAAKSLRRFEALSPAFSTLSSP